MSPPSISQQFCCLFSRCNTTSDPSSLASSASSSFVFMQNHHRHHCYLFNFAILERAAIRTARLSLDTIVSHLITTILFLGRPPYNRQNAYVSVYILRLSQVLLVVEQRQKSPRLTSIIGCTLIHRLLHFVPPPTPSPYFCALPTRVVVLSSKRLNTPACTPHSYPIRTLTSSRFSVCCSTTSIPNPSKSPTGSYIIMSPRHTYDHLGSFYPLLHLNNMRLDLARRATRDAVDVLPFSGIVVS